MKKEVNLVEGGTFLTENYSTLRSKSRQTKK
jgi:hypothetical protein